MKNKKAGKFPADQAKYTYWNRLAAFGFFIDINMDIAFYCSTDGRALKLCRCQPESACTLHIVLLKR